MLWSPSAFRHWVSHETQERSSKFFLAVPGIRQSASRRTPDVTLSVSSGFPVTLSAGAADLSDGCGVLHYAYLSIAKSRDLSPFAMRTAFLFSDYYGDSATLRLAPRRSSRISVRATSECAGGAPFGSLSEFSARRPSCERLGSRILNDLVTMASRQTWSSTDDRFHPWSLGFRKCIFHRSTRVLQSRTLHVFRAAPLRRHAAVPVGFRREVSR